jgi:hypothetical protein
MPIYFDKIDKDKANASGINVTFSESMPPSLINKWKESIQQKFERAEKSIRTLRFPALTIWNHGHSLAEPNAPDDFRNCIFSSISVIIKLLEHNYPLRRELFFFLCCLHKDAPGDLILSKLEKAFDNPQQMRYNLRNIALSIGNAELLWQKELFQKTLKIMVRREWTSFAFEILGEALWRSERLIYVLAEEAGMLKAISEHLYECLKSDSGNVSEKTMLTIAKHMELLLALLRTRSFDDKSVKKIFIPNSKFSNEFIIIIDTILDQIIEKNLKLQSYLKFDVKKPDNLYNTPDLIYALRLYLTGDSDAHLLKLDANYEV